MQIKLFKSRVAYRLMVLLTLAGLIPVVFLAVPSLNYISEKLESQLKTQLAQISRHWGLAIEERLDFIGSEMTILAADPSLRESHVSLPNDKAFRLQLSRWFKGLTVVKLAQVPHDLLGHIQPIPVLTSSEVEFLRLGQPLLFTRDDEQRLYIAQLLQASDPDRGVLIAEIQMDMLWQLQEALPSHTYGCVVNHALKPLVCSRELTLEHLKPWEDRLFSKSSGFLHTSMQDVDYIESFWSKFSNDALMHPNWSILVGTPASMAFAPMSQFMWLFPLCLMLATLLVFLLSIKQIRRVVAPLEQLREGTRNLANHAFHTEMDIQSGDEFEELAKSFNSMSMRLGKQFNTLETMARIDRLILSTLDMDSIIETILTRMVHAVHCDDISVLITMGEHAQQGKLYYRTDNTSSNIIHQEVELSTDDLLKFSDKVRQVFIEPPEPCPGYLKPISNLGGYQLLLPIYLDNALSAIIVLSYKKPPKYQQEDLRQARDLADRIAVALSNAAWENKLYQQAHYDNLTNLPNRLLFQDRIEHALKRAQRNQKNVALMFLDLDHFKKLNDTLGHAAGDAFLKELANRIKLCIRSIDTAARLGGDEFTIIIPDLEPSSDTLSNVSNIANKILQKTAAPLMIEDQEITLTISIGIAVYPTDADSLPELLKVADSALYYAKDQGRSNYQYYCKEIDAEARQLIQLEDDLQSALKRKEFVLFFQPKVSLTENRIIGAEALIRWHNKSHTAEPSQFIPLAESNGLILTLGEWVLKQACWTCKKWHSLGFTDLKISVNVAAAQFNDENFMERVRSALAEVDLAPEFLELEITEGTLIKDTEKAITILNEFNQMGINLSIDDFGTGYSSLSYLKQLPVHSIKIDKSFIKNIHQDKANTAIVSAIITLAEHLDLHVVAEGVEQHEELVMLYAAKCHEIQGFIYSKPLNEVDFIHYLQQNTSKTQSFLPKL